MRKTMQSSQEEACSSGPGRLKLECSAIFLVSYVLLFFGMSLHPAVYDEGLTLTAGMRVAAGQIPHRDFYTVYGPAQFYFEAGLFKMFGETILVERLGYLVMVATLVTSVYLILLPYCRRSTAAVTTLVVALWLFALGSAGGSPLLPALLLNLLGCAAIAAVFQGPTSRSRLFAAGAFAGLDFLFRYDTGIALFGIEVLAVAIAISLRFESRRIRAFAATIWPCAVGFAAIAGPPVALYLSVAPLHAFLHDIVIYPSRYYRGGRGLPFPHITLKTLDNIEIYLPVLIVAISLYLAVRAILRRRNAGEDWDLGLSGFVLTYSMLAAIMYFKGIVRISVVQEFLAIVPTLFLLAILFEKRLSFSRPLRTTIIVILGLSVVSVGSMSLRTARNNLYRVHASVPQQLIASVRHTADPVQAAWCRTSGPLTTGLCFTSDDDRIQTIEYISSHTKPGDKLYVGVGRHDKIIINDNLIYFATGRLPATKWSHFDPSLQNRADIQTEMIREFEAERPPYIVKDKEFDDANEPNDSSRSSGVTMIDDYIRNNYSNVQVYGNFSIWQRNPAP